MSETTQRHYEAEPAALRAWLATLGWDEAQGIHSVPTDPAVAAFGPFGIRQVMQQDVAFALLVLTAELEVPEGIFDSGVGGIAVGVFMQGPRLPTPFEWLTSAGIAGARRVEAFIAMRLNLETSVILDQLLLLQEVRASDAEVIAGVEALHGAGILTDDERAALLSA